MGIIGDIAMTRDGINILILEDDDNDAELIEHTLKKSAANYDCKWVKNKKEFQKALSSFEPDLILADFNLPAFNALQALEIVQGREIDTPFIIVSGDLEDTKALEAIKFGGTDFVLKENLFKLPIMVTRAIQEARVRKEKGDALIEIKEIYERQKFVMQTLGVTIFEWNLKTNKILYNSPNVISKNKGNLGLKEIDFEEGKKNLHPDDIQPLLDCATAHISGKIPSIYFEFRVLDSSKNIKWLLMQGQVSSWDEKGEPEIVTGLNTDITKRKQAELSLVSVNREKNQSLALLDTVYKTVPLGLLILDTEFRIISANNALSSLTGLHNHHHIGKSLDQVLPGIADKSQPLLNRVLKSGRPIMNFEMKGKLPVDERSESFIQTSIYPVENADHQLICMAFHDISNIKEAEDAIFQSEMRFHQLEEHINAVIWIIDAESNHLKYVSPSCQRFLGISTKQFLDDPFAFIENVYPEDQEWVEKGLLKFLNSEDPESFEMEFRMLGEMGKINWMSHKGFAVRDKKGTIVSYGTLMQDVTNRKIAENELLESQNMLLETQTIAHLGSFEWFIADNKVVWSDELYRIFGYQPKGIPNSIASYLKLTHPDDSEITKKAINQSIIERKGFEIEHRIVLPNKTIRVVSLIVKVKVNENNVPMQLLGLVQDVTDKKQAEDVAQRFGRILDSSQNELYIFREDNHLYIQASRSALQNLGYSLDELRSLKPSDIITDGAPTQMDEIVEPLKSGDQEGIVYEGSHTRKDGSSYPVEVRLQYLRSETPPVFLAEVSDISVRKKAQRARYEGQEMERKRIAMEIHDGIGQMLIAIKQRVSNLEFGKINENEWLDSIDEIDKILSMTIEEVRRTSNNLAPIVLKKMGIEDAINMICQQTEKVSRIKVLFDHKGPKIEADEKVLLAIYRILQEALNNMVKHSFATQAKVQFFQDNSLISLIIVDNGKGFNLVKDVNSDSNGLNNMKERATLVNGTFHIESNERTGTYIKVDVPAT